MRPDGPPVPVAIIGGGFSGTMLAAQLARRGIDSLLIEGGGRAGRGAAYSTVEPAHLLNVRADAMSAWPDDPEDFARDWGNSRGFAERRHFGRYLGAILDAAVASGRVEVVEAQAIAVRPREGCWEVELSDGTRVEARAVALAIGNQLPGRPDFASAAGIRFVDDPWRENAAAAVREAAANGGDVLIVGTGLTMIDTVLSLNAAGHEGRIVALSRRGQIPKAHGEYVAAPVDIGEIPVGDLMALWRWLRRQGAEVGWRAAVDALRPHSHAIWQSLDGRQQRRFLRHARPWWDVHRHRIAPQVARQIVDLVAQGRLEVVAGRIVDMSSADDGVEVEIRRRGAGEAGNSRTSETCHFRFVFNCTGPLGEIDRTRDPMLRQMLDDGLVRPDPLGLGLEVDENSRVSGGERMWALGPLTKGRYWEIVAVPDIRQQAAAIAADIAQEAFGPSR